MLINGQLLIEVLSVNNFLIQDLQICRKPYQLELQWEYGMSDHDSEWDHDDGLAVEEAKPKLKPPRKYKVILLNDDYTPMEFVVQILSKFFGMNQEQATQIMLMVHTKGKAICGEFSYQIAETKVEQVNDYSRQHQHPLLCTMEEA